MNQEFSPRRPGLELGPIRRGSSVRAQALDTFYTITDAAYGSLRPVRNCALGSDDEESMVARHKRVVGHSTNFSQPFTNFANASA
jgi:hypothetical protein